MSAPLCHLSWRMAGLRRPHQRLQQWIPCIFNMGAVTCQSWAVWLHCLEKGMWAWSPREVAELPPLIHTVTGFKASFRQSSKVMITYIVSWKSLFMKLVINYESVYSCTLLTIRLAGSTDLWGLTYNVYQYHWKHRQFSIRGRPIIQSLCRIKMQSRQPIHRTTLTTSILLPNMQVFQNEVEMNN